MKLVLATPLYPPEAGGPATFAKIIEEELPKHGWEVMTVKFRDVRHLPKLVRHIAYMRRVKRAAQSADAVLALDPVSTGLPAMWAAQRAGKRFFVRIAGDYAWEQGTQRFGVTDILDDFASRHEYAFLVRVLKKIQTHVARAAIRVIVPSEYLKGIVHAWEVSIEKITVAYNAAPTIAINTSGTAPFQTPYLISIGRLVPWKGMEVLIKAFGGVTEPKTLVIVGDGPEREKLEAVARYEGITERVIFTGNRSHEDTLRYLAHAESFILNTRYEGMSHLILEALALGVPVATTNAGGNSELIRDGETGLIYPYNNAEAMRKNIERLHADPALREKLAQAGKQFITTFTKGRMIDTVLEILTKQ